MNRPDDMPRDVIGAAFTLHVNGRELVLEAADTERLSTVLRRDAGLTGTKIGCHAGDCGACTVLLDNEQACACLVPMMQARRSRIVTVEGLTSLVSSDGRPVGARLQRAFALSGAAQCGICTPGMLMAAAALLLREFKPDAEAVRNALGGVLCRCTGYLKIVEAVVMAGADAPIAEALSPVAGSAIGARLERLDVPGKLTGAERFADDEAPPDALVVRVIRSPHAHAAFRLGDLDAWVRARPGVAGVLTAADIPNNRFAIFPELRDQPALADGQVRFRGEAVLAVVGSGAALDAALIDPPPIAYSPLPPVADMTQATAHGAPAVQSRYPDNILCRGHLRRGDHEAAQRAARHSVSGSMSTRHVEHAYIEPEAGHAVWHGADAPFDVTVFVTTQTPYLDRDEIAWMFGLEPARVRIVPSAVGGGFGGKLDMSVQPLLVAAARRFGCAARMVFERPESMVSSTKRHPAQMQAQLHAAADGRFLAYAFDGDFNTGAYASWGPTVANRVPIHACGPYRFDAVRADTRAVLTHDAVCGAFRGFGVPQCALLNEVLVDDMAFACGIDPLHLRRANALRAGDVTATGQTLAASVGLQACLDALEPAWREAGADVARFNDAANALADGDDHGPAGPASGLHASFGPGLPAAGSSSMRPPADPHGRRPAALRRGVGIACMWYGIGNTVIANPSTMRVGLRPDGRLMLYNGAVDIGQGSYTILPQICADALGAPVARFDQIHADTGLTEDAGKSSASRQTFVSGNAARFAGESLRKQLCEALGVTASTPLEFGDGYVAVRATAGPDGDGRAIAGSDAAIITDTSHRPRLDLRAMPPDALGDVFSGSGHFDPPTIPLDAHGQGVPYATYGFAAQFAVVEVDTELGTVRVLAIHAAHDVGRAINPVQVEGQIHGGIAQGLGLALMEDYRSGLTDNLHDYLIPTAGDMPPVTVHLIEDPEPLGPGGAKGVGEPALVATAPAILNAIRHATGARLTQVPVTPDVLCAALVETRT